mgnify:CR=1 FL=1
MYDLVIRGGTVVDGTGGDAFVADIAVDGDRIVAAHLTGLEVDRGASVAGRQTYGADLLARANVVPVLDRRRTQMAIDRAPAVGVHDQHRQPLPHQIAADIGHAPGRRGADCRAGRGPTDDAVGKRCI